MTGDGKRIANLPDHLLAIICKQKPLWVSLQLTLRWL